MCVCYKWLPNKPKTSDPTSTVLNMACATAYAILGKSRWLHTPQGQPAQTDAESTDRQAPEPTDRQTPHLLVARGKQPLGACGAGRFGPWQSPGYGGTPTLATLSTGRPTCLLATGSAARSGFDAHVWTHALYEMCMLWIMCVCVCALRLSSYFSLVAHMFWFELLACF